MIKNGITHFMRRVNKYISFGCANGGVAPFVGHNTFLCRARCFFRLPAGNVRKQWSEVNMSEDFDLTLDMPICFPYCAYSSIPFPQSDVPLRRWHYCYNHRFHPQLLLGLTPQIDCYYLCSFEIFFLACTVCFPASEFLGLQYWSTDSGRGTNLVRI